MSTHPAPSKITKLLSQHDGPVLITVFRFSEDISYLELWRPFCSAEQNHLRSFARGHNVEKFCEFIWNLVQWFRRRCRLKDFLSGVLAALLFTGAEPFM